MPTLAPSPRRCEFWLGRAGSGKTHGCLEAIAAELKRSARGDPLLFIVPEQASAQIERRLATWPGLAGGFTRARVLPFNHLQREAFTRSGGAPRRVLDEVGRVILLRRLLIEHREALRVFGVAAAQSGVAESVSATLLEFQRYGWNASDLAAWLATIDPEALETDLLARKLSDLADLWREYEALLARLGWQDPARRIEAAAEAIRGWSALAGAQLWIDGFASFTHQELTLLEALMGHASSVVMALCLDPAALAPGADTTRIGPERLFETLEETYHQLHARWTEAGWMVTTHALPDKEQPTRFARSPALAHLESQVLGRLWPGVFHETPVAESGGEFAIELIEAADRRAEVEAVARRIVACCRRDAAPPDDARGPCPPCTWREVAVLARDLAPYEALVREVFEQFDIPYFLDRPREIESHPLARLLVSALGVPRSGWSGEAVLRHFKSGLSALRDEDALCRLELWIRACDPRGPAAWRETPELASGDAAPDWKPPLQRLEAALQKGGNPARALWQFIEDCGVAASLDAWIAAARAAGREEEAQLHEQAWEQTVAWLEELGALAAADPAAFSSTSSDSAQGRAPLLFYDYLDQLSGWIESALGATRARLTPPTLNQVTVGAVDRSRTPEVRVAFVLGMNEKSFPRLWTPDPMLGDEERARLARGGRGLGPDTSRKRRQEHFLAYIALTRASERLVASRPLLDEEGKAGDASPYFTALLQAFPQAPRRTVARAGAGEVESLPLRPEEWALRLGGAVDAWRELGLARPLASWMAAGHPLAHAGLDDAARHALRMAGDAFAPPQPARLDPALAREFWRARPRLHVTALQRFEDCPFKFYANQVLGLAEVRAVELSVMDLGTIRHHVLDRIFRELRAPQGLAWGALDLEKADAVIGAALDEKRREPGLRERIAMNALNRLTLDTLARDVKLFVRAMRRAGRDYGLRQVESEYRFGARGELLIEFEDLSFEIHGTIDRIDAAPPLCVLIDYKSGARKIDLAKLIGGVDLQLPVYGLVLRRRGLPEMTDPARVAAFFYWSLASPLVEATSAGEDDPNDVVERWFKNGGPAGLFEADIASTLDGGVAPGGRSLAFGFSRTSSGALHGRSQAAWPTGALHALLDHVEGIVRDAARRIAVGEIAARPYRLRQEMACEHCDYQSVCRRAEPGVLAPRWLTPLTRDAALARLGIATGSTEAGQ